MDYNSDNDSDPEPQLEGASDEEPLSEEQSEDEEDGAPRKRAKTGRNYFIDDEVEEDEEEDDGFVDSRIKDRPSSMDALNFPRRAPGFSEVATDEVMKRTAARFDYKDHVEEDDEYDYHTPKGSEKPRKDDPRIWMLRCRKPGQEQAIVGAIMKRCQERQDVGKPLKIMSAFCADHIKGNIFVEAAQADDVREAVANIIAFQSSLPSTMKTPIIPLKERPDLLTVPRTTAALKRGDWVRSKRGLYKGDLAQVYRVDETEGKAWVKIIPRINLDALGVEQEPGTKRKRAQRVPARFYSRELIISKDGDFDLQQNYRDSTLGETFDLFKKERYKDGFLYKAIKLNSLDTNVTPALEELKNFQTHATDDAGPHENRITAALAVPTMTKQDRLEPGDTIKVLSGTFVDVKGVVVKVENGHVDFRPTSIGYMHNLRESLDVVQKFLDEGQSVQIIDGRFKGEGGLVTSVQGDVVNVYSHSSGQSYAVRMSDIKLSKNTAVERMKLGNYMLHDLVSVGQNSVGVIVKVERDSFKVLETTGTVKSVLLSEMGEKRRSATSFDKMQNQITAQNEVTVVEGVNKGKEGTVKYVYRHHLFIQCPGTIENGGIIVARSNYVVALGRTNVARHSNNFAPHSPDLMGAPDRGRGARGRGRGGRGGRGGRNDPLVGRKVKVIKGTYKGYMAIVRDCTEKNVRVELTSKSKVISLTREQIRVPDEQMTHYDRYSHLSSGKTPMIGDRTPMVGDRTPMLGDRTPMLGDRTPMLGDRTPMLGDRTPRGDTSPGYSLGTDSTWANDSDYHNEPTYNNPATPSVYDATSPYGQIGTPNDMAYPYTIETPAYGQPAESPYNTATPDAYPTTPATPGMMVQTPGMINPQTPGMMPQTPSMMPPTPGMMPPTPSMNPQTPGMMPPTPGMNPQTPGFGDTYESSYDNSWSLASGIEVRVSEEYSAEYAGKVGQLVEVSAAPLVRFYSGKSDFITASFLEPTPPQKKDRVKILSGDYRGQLGVLTSVSGEDGCVTLDGYEGMSILNINLLGKYVG